MTNRRDFFKTTSLVVAGSMIGANMLSAAVPGGNKKKKIGLQLYSLRDDMGKDALGTLKKVAAMGWYSLETASYGDRKIYGMAPLEFKKVVEDLGMKLTSCHLGGPVYTKETHASVMDWWKTAIEDHVQTGMKFMIKPGMKWPEKLDELKVQMDYFNAVGDLTKAAGMQFGWHNHNHEFTKIDDKVIFDFMLENTNPKTVTFEMDVYWVMKGGCSPVEYMKKYPKRFQLLHIKDEKEIGESGLLDFKSIYETAYSIGVKDFFVEVERYNFEPLVSVQKSYDFLASAPFVK
ncbi:MAG: TIM barrel protein [Marinilabiliales bacterium]|nr:TIM barrel protein [Marinilabiliales bacterium]